MMGKDYMGAKVEAPKVNQKVLPRNGIINIINIASQDEVVYLVAPFGCGKTFAVISWLQESKRKAAWVGLGAGEDTPISFYAHIITALQLLAGERQDAESILSDALFLENPRLYLRETLIRVSPAIKDRVLIIDNFKYICNKGLLLEIKEILMNMLGCWKIIIIGRTELPPIFNDFMLKKCLRIITLDELNFSFEETTEYFALNDIAVEQKSVIKILKETEGWPAALNVIVELHHAGPIEFNHIAKEYVNEFFEEEVWKQISDYKVKNFLMKTSILDKLTPSICQYVAEIEKTIPILRNLFANGVFLSKLDERGSFRYHKLFREFLFDKLLNSGVNKNTLYAKAGWWLYERNESIPALLYFFRANDLYGVNQAFKKIRPANIGMDKYVETVYCLTSLDVNDLKDYPEVAVRIAIIHFITNNITEMQRIYGKVLEWLEPGVLTIPSEDYIDFNWEVGWLRYLNPDENILFNGKFEAWANVEEYAPHLLESDRSRASALRLPSVLRGARDFSVDVTATEKYYEMNIATDHSIVRDADALSIMDLIIAEIAYEREDYEKAEKIVMDNIAKIEKAKQTELYFICISLLVKISRATNNRTEAEHLTERLEKMIQHNNHSFLIPNFNAFKLRNRLVMGMPGSTEAFLKDYKPYEDKIYYYLLYRHITYVRALLSESRYREANVTLSNLEILCLQYKRNMDLIEINILRSIAEYGLNHENAARMFLLTALGAGRNTGFIRIFSDDAQGLWPILKTIHKSEINDYIKRVMASCKRMLSRAAAGVSKSDKTSHEPLTSKEIEVLRLLQLGLSYNEIALETKKAINTVKTHIKSIYLKLNVDNKLAAIHQAEKEGIIEILK